jgi:hypothetical protein
MQLLCYKKGKFHIVQLCADRDCLTNVTDLENCIRCHMHMDGCINALCIDFCGEYVPLVGEDDVRLAAALLCVHHNSTVAMHMCRKNTDDTKCPDVHSLIDLQYKSKQCPAIVAQDVNTDDCGVSDNEEDKYYQSSLEYDFEINANIDASPAFGKVGMVEW